MISELKRENQFLSVYDLSLQSIKPGLKVLANEKRGGLSVVSFDRSGFKLFSL
jgi:hypothetical protein